ncbi:hypothetical protein B0F90DRAFT_1764110 [Multifurca ochricompacta]|uniref:Uncharacterized protein n=1 Tax=Multifurca ochricompacta TaxID=376703 RepID=A0AAD4QIS6_9AGAM|nr:hypothetical protein B0F90DRAFT_1764110 [Multifurca ochricompacta]
MTTAILLEVYSRLESDRMNSSQTSKKSLRLRSNQILLWKVLTPQHPGRTRSTINELMALINAIEFPGSTTDEAVEGNVLIIMGSPHVFDNNAAIEHPEKTLRVKARGPIRKLLTLRQAQELYHQAALKGPPSSKPAIISEYIKQQEELPIFNGRPFECYAPPIGLFHPVFNSFQEVLTSQDPLNLDDGACSSVKALQRAFANLYKNEADRLEAIHAPLNALLGGNLTHTSETGVTADRTITEACCGSTAYIAVLEMKNEIGTAHADPFIQAGLSYRRYWGYSGQVIRECSYCPTIILAIAGLWRCVSGYIWLGGSVFDEDQLHFTLRLFTALKLAISTLRSYYLTLGPTNKCPEDLVHAIPYVTPSFASTLTYISRPSPDQQSKLVYKAKFIHAGSSRPAVVKFVSRYNAKAH